jgi:hypothetical protein
MIESYVSILQHTPLVRITSKNLLLKYLKRLENIFGGILDNTPSIIFPDLLYPSSAH